jgi:hypothetical protein
VSAGWVDRQRQHAKDRYCNGQLRHPFPNRPYLLRVALRRPLSVRARP